MNNNSAFKWIFSCCLTAVFLSNFAMPCFAADAQLIKKSPNEKLTFGMTNTTDDCRYFLRKGDKELWEEPASVLSNLIAAWSANSKLLLFVEQDKFSLEAFSIISGNVVCQKVDEDSLLNIGASLIKYDWNAVNQGNVPHDLIIDLCAVGKNQFVGLYVRAKYPKRVIVKFRLELILGAKGVLVSQYIIEGHRFQS